MGDGRQYVMGRVVLPPEGARPPVIKAFTGPDPKIARLIEAARNFKRHHDKDSLQQLADAAEDLD